MTQTVYVVLGEQGEYSDRQVWVSGVFRTREAAQSAVLERMAKRREHDAWCERISRAWPKLPLGYFWFGNYILYPLDIHEGVKYIAMVRADLTPAPRGDTGAGVQTMISHPNRKANSRPINNIGRNAFPGDQVRIMMGPHKDERGRWWPNKTEYTPLSSGVDNTSEGAVTVQVVTIGTETVRFVGGQNANA